MMESPEDTDHWNPGEADSGESGDEGYALFVPQMSEASLPERRDDEERRRVLKERARVLARTRDDGRAHRTEFDAVEFQLASERYALPADHVREVFPLKELTPLPGVPPFVLGIANVRGRILTILDLGLFFGLPVRGLGTGSKALIVRADDLDLGLIADAIVGIRRIPVDEILPPPAGLPRLGEGFIRGVLLDRLIVLDASRILADRKLRLLEE